ncbi:MAG: exo-alpha-sialidase [Candidatus Pacebacteria bacterium]|nr:exo-alpha-sialidase [Candidatus Paceibacterota bacterium]
MTGLTSSHTEKLTSLLTALVNQEAAETILPPLESAPGFWFGGGNMAVDTNNVIWLVGRYRNSGDSRTGLEKGARGLECALFKSTDNGASFTNVKSWSKQDLSQANATVLSIEGTALYRTPAGMWELYVSFEKEAAYPDPVSDYRKPGTGVWEIVRLTGPSPDKLSPESMKPVLAVRDKPEYLHVKDPVVFDAPGGGTALLFATHPFCWSSGGTGLALRKEHAEDFAVQTWEVVPRGPAWDVASTRLTDRLAVPSVGIFKDSVAYSVYFYDGAECLRAHEQNRRAKQRPRGYSCEELGGALLGEDARFPTCTRLSLLAPLFVSPHGTGCSRYVKTLVTADGILASWQQAQPDGSQPLVGHFLDNQTIEDLLT